MPEKPLNAAFITGEHPFDSVALWTALNAVPRVNWFPQTVGNFAVDVADRRDWYDVLVFYHFNQVTPGGKEEWWEQGQRGALERLGTTSQGVFLLHHAILAYPDWDFWSDLVGIADRRFDYRPQATFDVQIADPTHEITRGLQPYAFTDETYLMPSAGPDSHVLLTTDSDESMETLAWTREVGRARVFCYQSGHGQVAVERAEFRRLVGRGLAWCAGRDLDEGTD